MLVSIFLQINILIKLISMYLFMGVRFWQNLLHPCLLYCFNILLLLITQQNLFIQFLCQHGFYEGYKSHSLLIYRYMTLSKQANVFCGICFKVTRYLLHYLEYRRYHFLIHVVSVSPTIFSFDVYSIYTCRHIPLNTLIIY